MGQTTRRTALAMLGLAPVGTIAAEDFSNPTHSGNTTPTGYSFGIGLRVSAALRRMADDIDARGTHVLNMEMRSKAGTENFVEHELKISFAINELPADQRGS